MTTFADLGLAQPLLKALATEGYETPTPIQAQAIPGVLAGKDLLGIAQTGTGKTAAFALPILHRLQANPKPAPRKGCRVLVLSPTRELATQIAQSFKSYGRHLGISVAVVFGGAKYGPQIKALEKGLDILVATPGRLIDHLDEKHANLSATEYFVLDEADQMLDLGFFQPIRRIVSHLPKARQNAFFSATMPTEIGKLAGELLKDPVKVSVTPSATTVERIKQEIIHVEQSYKREMLAELFAEDRFKRVIVFTKTKRGADRVAEYLEKAGVPAASIHGDKSQGQRERALRAFREGASRALVATDIAARGIDIDGVSHVINYELPFVPEAYVHRIGRTARAGASGAAISLVADDERNLLRDIERVTRQKIPATDRRRDKGLALMAKANKELDARETKSKWTPETDGVVADGAAGPKSDRRPGRGGGKDQPRRKFQPRGGQHRDGGSSEAVGSKAHGSEAQAKAHRRGAAQPQSRPNKSKRDLPRVGA